MIHPFASFWRGRRSSPFALLLPPWIALWIITALITARWRHLGLYSSQVAWFPAAALLAGGISVYRRSGAGFSWSQLAGMPEVRTSRGSTRPLAITGIRAHVRHPIYLAHFCEMLAWSVGSGLAVCYGLTALTVFTGAVMIALEDRELTQRFGAAYERYKRTVPAIFPRRPPRRTPYNP